MKRVLLAFLFLFSFVFLSACSNANSASSSSATNASSASSSSTIVDDYKLSVVAPTGAPAVALANIAINDKEQYSYIDAGTIGAQFTAAEKDIIVAPVNTGAKLYKEGKSTYRLGAVLTCGNIYVATQRTDIETVSDLSGKEIVLFGEATINYPIAKYALEQNGVTNATYTASTTAQATKDLLVENPNAIVVTAEPALTVVTNQLKQQGKTVKSFSIQELYKNATGSDYTQAALFIKYYTIIYHKSAVDKFLEEVKASCDLFTTNLDKAADNVIEAAIPGVPAAKPVLLTTLPKCSIKYVSALDAKSALEKTARVDLDKFGGAVPENEFYYSK